MNTKFYKLNIAESENIVLQIEYSTIFTEWTQNIDWKQHNKSIDLQIKYSTVRIEFSRYIQRREKLPKDGNSE